MHRNQNCVESYLFQVLGIKYLFCLQRNLNFALTFLERSSPSFHHLDHILNIQHYGTAVRNDFCKIYLTLANV